MQQRKFSSKEEFLNHCRGFMRVRRMSLQSEKSYLLYIRRYVEYFNRKPEEMGAAEIEEFLTHLPRKSICTAMNWPGLGVRSQLDAL